MIARRPGVGLFLVFLALYALTSSGNAFRVPDEFEVYFQAEHLADAGDISVPQTLVIKDATGPIFFGEFGLNGRPYAPYGPGVAFLIFPFHLAGRGLAALAGIPRGPLPGGVAWEFLVGGITALGMAFAAAMAVAGCHRACRALGAPPRRAIELAIILGAATILWPYGTTLYCEAWLAAAFVWAAALLVEARARPGGSLARVVVASLLLAIAIVTKPTAIVIAPAFLVAVLVDRHAAFKARVATAAALTVGMALGGGIQVAWNLERFGHVLDFGYNLAGMIPVLPARSFVAGRIPEGLVVQLLTPGKSLFLWAPATLLSTLALGACWRRDRALAAGLIAATGTALVFYAAYLFPDGGYSHGPRHLVPLVPLLMLPLAVPGIEVSRRALYGCAAIGVVIAALAASVSFFEDQGPVAVGDQLLSPYYDRIDPPPGSPDLRYRVHYIPFRFALTSGHWLSPARPAGNGPDFFALHLLQARRTLPGGSTIPPWLPWAVSLPWMAMLIAAAIALRRADDAETG